MLLAVVVIWGVAGPVIKFTLEGIDPLPFFSYRLAISAVISIFFFLAKHNQQEHENSNHTRNLQRAENPESVSSVCAPRVHLEKNPLDRQDNHTMIHHILHEQEEEQYSFDAQEN